MTTSTDTEPATRADLPTGHVATPVATSTGPPATATTTEGGMAQPARVEPDRTAVRGHRPVAVVTGASRGLGRAVAGGLADRGWSLVLDARGVDQLRTVVDELSRRTTVVGVPGDVTDPDHRRALATAVADLGGVDLLVNNAGGLGPSPLPRLADLDTGELADLLAVNTIAPLGLVQALFPEMTGDATIVNITSDAAVEAWEGWGGYGVTKAALEHLTSVLAIEHPNLHVHAVDPGDLRTAMHQAAFPGEDISDRPLPTTVVPVLLRLVSDRRPSGRHRLDPSTVDVAADRDGPVRAVPIGPEA